MGLDKSNAPLEWPKHVCDLYDPIRSLGTGGFGSVWLAKVKESASQDVSDDALSHVAIKVVGTPMNMKKSANRRRAEKGYFHREELVLKEISHPNIMRVLNIIQEDTSEISDIKTCAPYCMILSYHKGPTLEMLLNHGGALGMPMARDLSRQLLVALSYLHGCAVIHRDIKPDNIIVTGANRAEDDCWSDGVDAEEAVKSQKWHLILIDFGFARPLHPDDMNTEKLDNIKEPRDDELQYHSVNDPLESDEGGDALTRSGHKISGLTLRKGRSSNNLDASISKVKVRGLSAVGNKNYAAPEILKGIRDSSRNKNNNEKGNHEPLAECVSDYGMVADAYSAGATIRFMLTGVPPSESVEDFMARLNNPLSIICRALICKSKNPNHREKRYRSNEDLSNNARRLVLGLTHWNDAKRTTVRAALSYEWVREDNADLEGEKSGVNEVKSSEHGDKVKYLKCALEREV